MADDSVLDPAGTLGPEDPLRAWADQNIDWRTGRLLAQDPQKAIESMISRGIAPPDVHAPPVMAYSDPMGNETGGLDPGPPIRTNRDGTIAGNITAPSNPDAPQQPVSVPLPVPRPAAASALDPEEDAGSSTPTGEIPLPKARPAEADAKKPSAGDALGDFSKSLSGVKALQAPPLNPVGTPSVRSPSAVSAPNLANIIALSQGTAPQTVLQRLGQLLVQGKAG